MSDEIVITDLIKATKNNCKYLFKKKWTIIFVSFIFGIIGIVYTWLQEPKYTAQLTFVAENEKSGMGGYAGIAAQFGFDLGGGSNNAFGGDNLMELLKSRTLIDMTLLTPYGSGNKLLIDQYITNHKINKNWSKDTCLSKIKFEPVLKGVNLVRDSILNKISGDIIKSKLDVDKVDKKLDIIYINMTDKDQFFAKKFVETLADNAILYYTTYKTKKNLANVNILQHQSDSVRGMLFGNVNDVASINDLNVNPIKQALRTSGQKKQIDLQVNVALYTELLKNLELAKLSLRKETPLIQIVDTPHLPLKNEKKGRLFSGIIFAFLGFIITCGYFLLQVQLNKTKVS